MPVAKRVIYSCKLLLLLTIAFFCFRCASSEIVLTLSSGDSVRIPIKGVRGGSRGRSVADDLVKVAEQRNVWAVRHEADPAAAEVLDTMVQLEDTAILNLSSAYTQASQSHTVLQAHDFAIATTISASLMALVRRDIVPRQYVETHIRANVPDYAIWYLSDREYSKKTGRWSTYEFGQRLRIGAYHFLVTPAGRPDGTPPEAYGEYIVIFDDPTERLIRYDAKRR